jgi:phosphatidylserine/phosphatidylglycerophosphate/cardiolipin synthase-like enzyme
LFAQPATNTLQLNFGTSVFSGDMILTNMYGQRLMVKRLENAQGQITVQAPLLTSGKYFVTLQDGYEKVSQSFGIVR